MNGKGYDRRDFMKVAGLGGLVFASGLPGCASYGQAGSGQSDFHFVQLSDVHWGYNNPKVNPEARGTLQKAVAAVNSLEEKPDFVVFTGDLTQTTDDPKVRRQRLVEFRDQAAALKVPKVYYFAGEHDASLDRGEAYQEVIGGPLYYTFDHKGIHFIVLDNTLRPGAASSGAKQIEWLKADLARQKPDAPIVVLTHRPLFPAAAAVGLGDARRHGGGRRVAAVPERDRVLRPHPPRAPPQDRAHRAPRGEGGDVPAVAGGHRAAEDAAAVGSAPGRTRGSASAASRRALRGLRPGCASCRSRKPCDWSGRSGSL